MALWRRMSRVLPVPFYLFYGRAFLPLPFRHPVVTVIGKPLDMRSLIKRPPGTMYPIEPTVEEMEVVYGAFKEELRRLYETYKPSWETRPLVVLDAPPLQKAQSKGKVTPVQESQPPQ